MFNNGEDSRKRKTKEVVGKPSNPALQSNNQIDYLALRGSPLVSPPGVPHVPLFQSLETSRAQHAFNMASHTGPFSYQYLLNGPDPEGYLRSFDQSENRNASQPIGQIIALHGEILKNELSGMVEKLAEAKVENILKQKEQQLKRRLNYNDFLATKAGIYREQAEGLLCDVKSLEQTANSLRKTIKETNGRLNAEAAQDNPEYYYVDPIKLGPVWLDCRECRKHVATVMMMPCRHICICTQCQDVTMACPVCGQAKGDCVEVYLPYK